MRSGPRRCGGRGPGAVHNAASLRSRLTTVTPRPRIGLRNGALAYAPSATTHTGLPRNPSHVTAHRIRSAASSSLVRNAGRCHGSIEPRFFRRTYRRARSGRAITPPRRVGGEQPEDDLHVPVHERAAGRTGGRVVVDPGPLDVPPVPLGRGVVEGERQPGGTRNQRLHD